MTNESVIQITPVQKKASNAPPPSVVVVETQQKKKQKNKKRKNRKGKKKAARDRLNQLTPYKRETEIFKRHILRPDAYGPFRQPRMGGSDRTGLAYDIMNYNIVGDGTNTIKGFQGNGAYTSAGLSYAVAAVDTSLGAGTSRTSAAQFPSGGGMADINLTATCLVIYYTGNPLNVAGELIIGSSIPIASTSTFAAMYNYPGTLRIPVAECIRKPLVVSGRKLSAVADEFVSIGSGQGDYDYPFVFASGLPTGGNLVINQYRTFEYRSTTVASNVINYERVGNSHSGDVAAYQDARAEVAEMPSPVSPAYDGRLFNILGQALGFGANVAALSGAVGTLGMIANHHINRLRAGQNNRMIEMDDFA